jgi:hypothetical protein
VGSATVTAPPPQTATDFKSATEFRSSHLEVRTITAWSGGGSWVFHQGYRFGGRGPGPRWGVGVSTVVAQPMIPEHGWAVFQGPTRLEVPAYLDLVKDPRANDYRRRIRSNQNAGVALNTVGVMGIAVLVTGIVGAQTADDRYEHDVWNNVSLGGVGGMLVGFTGGSLANGTARRLEYDYGEIGWEATRAQVDAYNDELRSDLGLSSDQAWRIIEEGGGGDYRRR